MKPEEPTYQDVQYKSFDDMPSSGFVRLRQLIPDVLPFSQATYYRKCQEGLFPPPIKLGERISANSVSEVRAVKAAYAAGKTNAEIKALVKRLLARRLELATE